MSRTFLFLTLTLALILNGCTDSDSDDSTDLPPPMNEDNGSNNNNGSGLNLDADGDCIAGPVTDFLWKPEAESTFNKGGLIIHADPCVENVRVTPRDGGFLGDFGSGNGRCRTFRFQDSGCSFGNATVRMTDDNGCFYTFPGAGGVETKSFNIPNGCRRTEFVR